MGAQMVCFLMVPRSLGLRAAQHLPPLHAQVRFEQQGFMDFTHVQGYLLEMPIVVDYISEGGCECVFCRSWSVCYTARTIIRSHSYDNHVKISVHAFTLYAPLFETLL